MITNQSWKGKKSKLTNTKADDSPKEMAKEKKIALELFHTQSYLLMQIWGKTGSN